MCDGNVKPYGSLLKNFKMVKNLVLFIIAATACNSWCYELSLIYLDDATGDHCEGPANNEQLREEQEAQQGERLPRGCDGPVHYPLSNGHCAWRSIPPVGEANGGLLGTAS